MVPLDFSMELVGTSQFLNTFSQILFLGQFHYRSEEVFVDSELIRIKVVDDCESLKRAVYQVA